MLMSVRKTLLAIGLATSFAGPFAAHAANFSIDVDVAPPAPVYEQLPPREGYVVTQGYYLWVKGG
jgi:hypothetical protein